MNPRIEDRGAFRVVGETGRFTPSTTDRIPALWGRFAPRMAAVPGRTEPRASYGLCEPGVTDDAGAPAFAYTAGVAVGPRSDVPAGMGEVAIPAGRYAIFTHDGPIREIGKTWDAIHHRGLREAGLEKDDGVDFERYDERWDPRTGTGPVEIWVRVRGGRGAGGGPRKE